MKRISSRATFAIKWLLPVVWGVLLVAAVAARWQDGAATPGNLAGLGVGVLFAVALYVVVVWPLADTVDDDVDALVVSRHGQEHRVRLADVERVSALPFFNPPRIRLQLRQGSTVVFLAPKEFRLFLQAAHPVVDELAARVSRAAARAREGRPMTTVFGLGNCDTTKKARNWLTRFGIAHEFVDYRDNRQAPETLKAWRDALGGWEALVNKQSTTWRNLPEPRKTPHSDPEWTLLLKEYPQLVKRPVLVTDDGAVSVGFTDNGWKKRFGVEKK